MNRITRRDWLHTTALAVGLGSMSALTGRRPARGEEAARPPRRFRAALVCSAIGVRADQRQAIEYAARFGFEAVEPQPEFLARLSDEELATLRQEMQEKRLTWSAAGLPVDCRGDIDAFTQSLRRFPRFCEVLQRAGIDRVGTWVSPTHNERTYLENFRLHAKRLRAVANIAGGYGLRLGLEYVGPKKSWSAGRYPFIHTMREMRELIAEIDHPCVGLTLDSWHWYTAGETVEDLRKLPGDRIVIVHLNDAPSGVPVEEQIDSVRDLPCATGVIDLKGFLGALVEIGFDGPAYIEPFKKELRQMPPEEALQLTAEAMQKAIALVES